MQHRYLLFFIDSLQCVCILISYARNLFDFFFRFSILRDLKLRNSEIKKFAESIKMSILLHMLGIFLRIAYGYKISKDFKN